MTETNLIHKSKIYLSQIMLSLNFYDLVNPNYLIDSKTNHSMLQGKKAEMTQILKIHQTLNL